ncbi:MAG: hypothetical protein ACLTTF_11080, partial [Oscillospiraceae bacterium]
PAKLSTAVISYAVTFDGYGFLGLSAGILRSETAASAPRSGKGTRLPPQDGIGTNCCRACPALGRLV